MRMLTWIGRGFLALVVIAALAYPLADWMRDPLDDAARAELLRTKKAEQFVQLSHGIVHVRVHGPADGPVILLIHGVGTGGYVFSKWIAPLSDAGYRVIVPDLLGYGYSERPSEPHTKVFFTSQLSELLDALGVKARAHIVGTSMGGAVVTAFVAKAPERVKTVTLVAPAGLGRTELFNAAFLWPVVGDWFFRVLGPTVSERNATKTFADVAGGEGMIAWLKEQLRFRGYSEGQLNTFRNFDILWQPVDYAALGHSGLPVLAVWGTADATIPFAQSKALIARVPQATLVKLDGKPHAIAFTDAETVLALVTPFLKANDAH